MNGTLDLHLELEHELADWMQREAALVFTAGYLANLATIATLCGPEDVIVTDAKNHASIEDGAQLSGARVVRVRHNDLDQLEAKLGRLAQDGRAALVVWDTVFSMEGDVVDLPAPARGEPGRRGAHADRRSALARALRPRRRRHVARARPGRGPGDGHVQQVARVVRRRDRRRRRRDRAPPHPRPPVRVHRVRGAGGGRCGTGGAADLPRPSRGGGRRPSRWRPGSPTACARRRDVSFGGSADRRGAHARRVAGDARLACAVRSRRLRERRRLPRGAPRRGAAPTQHHVGPRGRRRRPVPRDLRRGGARDRGRRGVHAAAPGDGVRGRARISSPTTSSSRRSACRRSRSWR